MTIIKRIGVALITLILLVLLLISLTNWNWARDFTAQQISDITDRKFSINGELNIDWSLTPHISIEQIQFENAALDLRIDLIELLKGHVVLPEVVLTKPQIILERSAEGETNWDIQTEEADPDDKTNFAD